MRCRGSRPGLLNVVLSVRWGVWQLGLDTGGSRIVGVV